MGEKQTGWDDGKTNTRKHTHTHTHAHTHAHTHILMHGFSSPLDSKGDTHRSIILVSRGVTNETLSLLYDMYTLCKVGELRTWRRVPVALVVHLEQPLLQRLHHGLEEEQRGKGENGEQLPVKSATSHSLLSSLRPSCRPAQTPNSSLSFRHTLSLSLSLSHTHTHTHKHACTHLEHRGDRLDRCRLHQGQRLVEGRRGGGRQAGQQAVQ